MKSIRNTKLVWSGRTVRARCDRCGCHSVGVDGSQCREVAPEALERAAFVAIWSLGWSDRNGELPCVSCVGDWSSRRPVVLVAADGED